MEEFRSTILSSYQQSSETIVLKYIFDIIEKISCQSKKNTIISILWKIISTVSGGSIKIVGILILQHLVKDPNKLFEFYNSHIKPFTIELLYNKFTIIYPKQSRNENSFVSVEMHDATNDKYLFPVIVKSDYLTNDTQTTIYTLPFIHDGVVNRVKQNGHIKYVDYHNKRDTRCVHDNVVVKPLCLFPSKNYIKLHSMIHSYNEVTKKTGMRQPRAILINGEPGLGKTCAIDALADMGRNNYDAVCRINMTLYNKKSDTLQTIFESCISKLNGIKGLVIILFDELDKYLEYNIKYSYDNYIAKLKKNTFEKVVSKDDIPINVNIEIPNYDDYYISKKEDFLYELLHLIEIDNFEHGIVFLFCTNNFNTIFDKVNMVHFTSLKNRLVNVTFERCDKSELINYINFYNDKLVDTQWYYEQQILSMILNKIRDDLSIPYRILTHNLILAEYNMEKFVHINNNWENEHVPENKDGDIKRQFCIVEEGFPFPTIDDILPEIRTCKGSCEIPSNGLVFCNKVYTKNDIHVQSYSCSNYQSCEIYVFCKCGGSTCACSLEWLEWNINPNGEGYICSKCDYKLNGCSREYKYYPTKDDLNGVDDLDNKYYVSYKRVTLGCSRRETVAGACGVVIGCMKCDRSICSCTSVYKGWVKNREKGYSCKRCKVCG